MNEESPYRSIELELEARIVALVLGEASDLERDELNRLIEHRPELAAFKSRMEGMHGLLQDVGTVAVAADDDHWKLSADRREAVLAVIRGAEKVQPAIHNAPQSARQRASFNRSLRWSLSKAAAILCVVGFIGMSVVSSFFRQETMLADRNKRLSLSADGYSLQASPEDSIESIWLDTDLGYGEGGGRGAAGVDGIHPLFGVEQEKNPETALSAIRNTLEDYATLPSESHRAEQGRLVPRVSELELFNLELAEDFQHDLPESDDVGGGASQFESGTVSQPIEVDSPELIAGNEDGWKYEGFKDDGQRRYGRVDSRPMAPQQGDRALSFPMIVDSSGEVSHPAPTTAGVRSTVTAVDGGTALFDEVKRSSESFDSRSGGEFIPPSNPLTREHEDRPTRGMNSGSEGRNGTRNSGDVPVPDEELPGSRFEREKFRPPVSGPQQWQAQQELPERTPWGRDFSEHLRFSQEGEIGSVRERIANDTKTKKGFSTFEDSQEKQSPPTATDRGETKAPSTLSGEEKLDAYPQAIPLPDPKPEPTTPSAADGNDENRNTANNGLELFWEKSDEMPRGGEAELPKVVPGDKREPDSIRPTPLVTGSATDRPSVEYSVEDRDEVLESWGRLPSQQKEPQMELQRDSGGLDFDNNRLAGRYRYFAPSLVDNSESMNRPAVKVFSPPAGLNEVVAADEAFSTFSLHVSDVSFKLAQAALARGEWPEAATIRIEEFVNAFDYGDPLPCNDEKVACLVEQSIHPFIQQRNLLRVSMRTAAAGRSSNTPLRLTFLLDNSGSMERIDRRQTVRRAFALLAQQLTPIDQVTLLSFARQPRLLADKLSGTESEQLVRLIDELPSEGGTNIEAALQLAFEKARENQAEGAQNRIILLTDGAVNLGDANPERLSRMVATMRAAGIAFDAAGICAEGLNDEVLEALTRKGDGRYYLLDSLESVDDGFARQIAGALRPSAKNVKVQIEFNPKRVGSYKLLGFEKHILKQEDFRNDKVDAAEMAAAEAGVAMYQFEAKPDGEGDVGSVSVRFRDLSTGKMIENRWPIPYEAAAPRPDQAAPSLRIAASAALLAAKLRGEPLGETVDLRELFYLMSGLPDQHRHDTRVRQLNQMIEQARQMSGN